MGARLRCASATILTICASSVSRPTRSAEITRPPVVFNVPLSTNTTVILNHDTAIPNTMVYLNGLPVPTNIVLPAGTPLDINLNLIVPISESVPVVLDVPIALNVPVSLTVPVDIPLSQTELHTPFTGLANLVGPYDVLLAATPSSWAELFHLK